MRAKRLPGAKSKIPPAGQRRDMTRRDNGAAVTFEGNLRDAIEWQREHRQ